MGPARCMAAPRNGRTLLPGLWRDPVSAGKSRLKDVIRATWYRIKGRNLHLKKWVSGTTWRGCRPLAVRASCTCLLPPTGVHDSTSHRTCRPACFHARMHTDVTLQEFDGASKGNPGCGGCGALLVEDRSGYEVRGRRQTGNKEGARCELCRTASVARKCWHRCTLHGATKCRGDPHYLPMSHCPTGRRGHDSIFDHACRTVPA